MQVGAWVVAPGRQRTQTGSKMIEGSDAKVLDRAAAGQGLRS
jgi:hypothetical protein